MKLSEYQLFAEATAQPRAYNHQYLIPMIVGEIGELFGQKAKSFWHGWDADKLEIELVSEYGDIAWGTAILLKGAGVEEVHPTSMTYQALDPWQALLNRAHFIHMFHSNIQLDPLGSVGSPDWVIDEAKTLWLTLELHAEAITGASFESILMTNLAKLAGRVSRGTLLGQGDHR